MPQPISTKAFTVDGDEKVSLPSRLIGAARR
jgi:hypothetical protein